MQFQVNSEPEFGTFIVFDFRWAGTPTKFPTRKFGTEVLGIGPPNAFTSTVYLPLKWINRSGMLRSFPSPPGTEGDNDRVSVGILIDRALSADDWELLLRRMAKFCTDHKLSPDVGYRTLIIHEAYSSQEYTPL